MKHLLPTIADACCRLSSSLQRRVKAWEGSVSSCGERFFSEELLLSASVLFLPVLYMTAAFALLSDIGIDMERGRWVFPTGLLLWGVAVVALHREERWHKQAATLLLLLAGFALAAWATSFLLDNNYDSRDYHSQAILDLLEGVNPYRHPNSWLKLWVILTYPVAHWLLSASLIVWTHMFEVSFVFTVVATLSAFFCARRYLATLQHLSRFWRNVLAFLLAANPIATWCFFTNHTDGLLVSTLLSVFLLMLCFVSEGKRQSRTTRLRAAFCIACLLVFLINIKFTGLVFGGILGLTALAYGARRGASRKTLVQLAGLGSAATILGVALFGFYPYATNAYLHGNPVHPFYPAIVYGEEKQEIVFWEDSSPVFSGRSQYEKWWISLFSKSGSASGWDPVPLPPFSSLRPGDFLYGFGSLFSGALLLCLTLVFFVRHRGAWLVLAGVAASIFLFEVGFSFRHAPQNWWLPVLFLVFLLAPDEKKNLLSRAQRAQRIVILVVVACLLYASIQSVKFYGGASIETARVVRKVERQGGWFIVPDPQIKNSESQIFFDYYDSGLSGVRLPTMPQCPEKAETRRLVYGLVLCKP